MKARHTQTHTHKYTDTHTHIHRGFQIHIHRDTHTCTPVPTHAHIHRELRHRHTHRHTDTHTSRNFNWCPLPWWSWGHCVETRELQNHLCGRRESRGDLKEPRSKGPSWASWFEGLNSKLPSSASQPRFRALTRRGAQGCQQEAKSSMLRLRDLGTFPSVSEHWFAHR